MKKSIYLLATDKNTVLTVRRILANSGIGLSTRDDTLKRGITKRVKTIITGVVVHRLIINGLLMKLTEKFATVVVVRMTLLFTIKTGTVKITILITWKSSVKSVTSMNMSAGIISVGI
ncbi:hypothetical protein QPL86_11755 [Bacillus bombysepticus]|nr:hypothetical protein QPL86_11755 [Bacillus bombysepticus]